MKFKMVEEASIKMGKLITNLDDEWDRGRKNFLARKNPVLFILPKRLRRRAISIYLLCTLRRACVPGKLARVSTARK